MKTDKIVSLCRIDDELDSTSNYCEKLLNGDLHTKYTKLTISAPNMCQAIDLSLYPELRPAVVLILKYIVKCTAKKRKDLRIEVSRLAMEGL